MYMDFVNAINGAKLKSKYHPETESLNIVTDASLDAKRQSNNSRFFKEMEMMKPPSQQKGRRRLRPSSAKPIEQPSKKKSGQPKKPSYMTRVYNVRRIPWDRSIDTPQYSTRSTNSLKRSLSAKKSVRNELSTSLEQMKRIQIEQHEMMKVLMHQSYKQNLPYMIPPVQPVYYQQRPPVMPVMPARTFYPQQPIPAFSGTHYSDDRHSEPSPQ